MYIFAFATLLAAAGSASAGNQYVDCDRLEPRSRLEQRMCDVRHRDGETRFESGERFNGQPHDGGYGQNGNELP